MAHPSFSDRDDGSRQRAWTKTLKTLRHVAADRVANEKLMERGFMTQWDNRNASKARAFRMKVDEHTDQRLVDYLATQVTTNGAWKKRDKKDGERTRAQWEDLVPQAREWLDEQNPDAHVNILHISNLSSMASGIFLAHTEKSWKNPGNEVQQTAGSCCPWNRGSSEGNVPRISQSGHDSDHTGSPRQGHKQN